MDESTTKKVKKQETSFFGTGSAQKLAQNSPTFVGASEADLRRQAQALSEGTNIEPYMDYEEEGPPSSRIGKSSDSEEGKGSPQVPLDNSFSIEEKSAEQDNSPMNTASRPMGDFQNFGFPFQKSGTKVSPRISQPKSGILKLQLDQASELTRGHKSFSRPESNILAKSNLNSLHNVKRSNAGSPSIDNKNHEDLLPDVSSVVRRATVKMEMADPSKKKRPSNIALGQFEAKSFSKHSVTRHFRKSHITSGGIQSGTQKQHSSLEKDSRTDEPYTVTSQKSQVHFFHKLNPTNNCVQRKFEQVIFGKYKNIKKKSKSTTSLQEPNHLEIVRCRKILQKEHPLFNINAEDWNNIPICLVKALKTVIKHITDSDEILYEFEVKTNERLYKLQEQLVQIKDRVTTQNQKIVNEVDFRIKQTDDNIQTKIHELDKDMKGSANAQEQNRLRLKRMQEALEKKIKHVEELQQETADHVNQFEKETKDTFVTLETNLIDFSKMTFEAIKKKVEVDIDKEDYQGPKLFEIPQRDIKSRDTSSRQAGATDESALLSEELLEPVSPDLLSQKEAGLSPLTELGVRGSPIRGTDTPTRNPFQGPVPLSAIDAQGQFLPRPEKAHAHVITDLKEFTINKFKELEPEIYKQILHVQTNLSQLESKFQGKFKREAKATEDKFQARQKEHLRHIDDLHSQNSNLVEQLQVQKSRQKKMQELVDGLQVELEKTKQLAQRPLIPVPSSPSNNIRGEDEFDTARGHSTARKEAKQSKMVQMLQGQIDLMQTTIIPQQEKKMVQMVEDSKILVKQSIDRKLKKIIESIQVLAKARSKNREHRKSHNKTRSFYLSPEAVPTDKIKRLNRSSAQPSSPDGEEYQQPSLPNSIPVSSQDPDSKQISQNVSMVDIGEDRTPRVMTNVKLNASPHSKITHSIADGAFNFSNADMLNSSSGDNNDEYTRLLIRQEFDMKIKDFEQTFNTQVTQKIQKLAIELQDSVNYDEVEKLVDQKVAGLHEQIAQIFSQMKIIRLMQQTLGATGPRKKKEDDPSYEEYSNFTKSIDETKIIEYLQLPKNKFDRDIQKLLRIFKRRSTQSNDRYQTDSVDTGDSAERAAEQSVNRAKISNRPTSKFDLMASRQQYRKQKKERLETEPDNEDMIKKARLLRASVQSPEMKGGKVRFNQLTSQVNYQLQTLPVSSAEKIKSDKTKKIILSGEKIVRSPDLSSSLQHPLSSLNIVNTNVRGQSTIQDQVHHQVGVEIPAILSQTNHHFLSFQNSPLRELEGIRLRNKTGFGKPKVDARANHLAGGVPDTMRTNSSFKATARGKGGPMSSNAIRKSTAFYDEKKQVSLRMNPKLPPKLNSLNSTRAGKGVTSQHTTHDFQSRREGGGGATTLPQTAGGVGIGPITQQLASKNSKNQHLTTFDSMSNHSLFQVELQNVTQRNHLLSRTMNSFRSSEEGASIGEARYESLHF